MIDIRTAAGLGLLLILGFLASASATATSYVPISDEDLLAQSALVIVGRVVEIASGPVVGPPSTEVSIQVEDVLKGRDPGARVTVHVLGGQGADGRGLRIFGAPRFQVGESVLLFLNPRRDRSLRIVQFHLGAFHVVEVGGRLLAVRDLAEATQLPSLSDPQRSAALSFHQPRDVERFGRWLTDRAAGLIRTPDYLVNLDARERLRLAEKFTLLRSSDDGEPTRWFVFDGGGVVQWHIDRDGLQRLPGGGRTELRQSLDVWEREPRTGIDFTFAGDSGATAGFTEFDDLNVLLFEDPNDEVEGAFSCVRGGTLAVGGPWFTEETFLHNGERFHLIGGGDIVANNGIDCAVVNESQVSLYYQELFTHELGHTLGLGHSCGDSKSPPCFGNPALDDALMRAQFHGDGRGGRLSPDDVQGIRHLYEGTGGGTAAGQAAPSDLSARVEGLAIRLTWRDNSSDESGFEIERGVDGAGFQRIGQVSANVRQLVDAGVLVGVTYTYRVRSSSSRGPSAYSNSASATVLSSPGCAPSAFIMCALDGRFRVDMSWANSEGGVGSGRVVPVDSDSSGLFWFFDPENWEVLVKVLDGCGLNQRFWVFAAATTDVGYTLKVIDTETGSTRLYTNPLGVQSSAITDAEAFATCP